MYDAERNALKTLSESLKGISKDISCQINVSSHPGGRGGGIDADLRLVQGTVRLSRGEFPHDISRVDARLVKPILTAWPSFLEAIEDEVQAQHEKQRLQKILESNVKNWVQKAKELASYKVSEDA